ncbi:MAG: hypothetical protein SNG27_10335 [Rikenellaceae bacterium]
MKGKDFFGNLRESHDDDFDFVLPNVGTPPPKKGNVIKQLSIEKNATNINVTVTLNQELFRKIDKVQKELQKRSKDKVSKSRVIAKICEKFLSEYDG